MKSKDIFNTPEEEIKRLAGEIGEVKKTLGELSRVLSRIETRVKRAFPSSYPKTKPLPTKKVEHTLLTTEKGLHFYDELVCQARAGENSAVHNRLSSTNIDDLKMLRKELGISLGKKKPSTKVLVEAIMGRINESVMLSKHTDRKHLIENSAEKEN